MPTLADATGQIVSMEPMEPMEHPLDSGPSELSFDPPHAFLGAVPALGQA